MKKLRLLNCINCNPFWHGTLLAVVLTWFALSPTAPAVSPAPDGGYSGDNTAEGTNALFSLTSGQFNTAIGFQALYHNTTGVQNTANGYVALFSNTTGNYNTANGSGALLSNTTGGANTATGNNALERNTTGGANTATGSGALTNNKSGSYNTANGLNALIDNTTGVDNTANGFEALFSNTTGGNNTANGAEALLSNTTGNYNTANGAGALQNNTTGRSNTADGVDALFSNTTGISNAANGAAALFNNTTGGSNIALGFTAGLNLTTGSNNIDIGNVGVAGEANKIRTVGTQTATFIAGIHGATVTGTAVVVSSDGQLGVAPSSARFKEAIKPMDKASETILALKPVTFRYKKDLDPEGIPQFGLVAEQVEKVNRDLVARDAEGKVYTVRYEAVNAMLLNEFLKEHSAVQELKSTVAKQEATIAQQRKDFQSTVMQQQKEINALTTSLKEQAAQIQKVGAQRELSKLAPIIVANQ